MRKAAASEVKNRFGQMLETAMTEPIAIEKKGRPVAVIISIQEYEQLTEIEDRYWGDKALKAVQEGFATADETKAWLESKLNAKAAR
jgi:antitoxin Phd